jgi:hypothetical protein
MLLQAALSVRSLKTPCDNDSSPVQNSLKCFGVLGKGLHSVSEDNVFKNSFERTLYIKESYEKEREILKK